MKLTKRDNVDITGPVMVFDRVDAFRYESSVSAGYTELTSVLHWCLHLSKAVSGFEAFRNAMITKFVSTWATLNDADKKLLITLYIWDSTETIPNLDLLYTQAERDDFLLGAVTQLDEKPTFNLHPSPDGVYWNMLPNNAGTVVTTQLVTDVIT